MRETIRRQRRIASPVYNRIIWMEGVDASVQKLLVPLVVYFNKRCAEAGVPCQAETDGLDMTIVHVSNRDMPNDELCATINDLVQETVHALGMTVRLPPFRDVPYPEEKLASLIDRKWYRNAETRERIDRVLSKMRHSILRLELRHRSDILHKALLAHAGTPFKKETSGTTVAAAAYDAV